MGAAASVTVQSREEALRQGRLEAETNLRGRIACIEIDVTVIAGRGLAAMDRSLLGKRSSDPYCVVSHSKWENEALPHKTSVAKKTLSPEWNDAFKVHLGGQHNSKAFKNDQASGNCQL